MRKQGPEPRVIFTLKIKASAFHSLLDGYGVEKSLQEKRSSQTLPIGNCCEAGSSISHEDAGTGLRSAVLNSKLEYWSQFGVLEGARAGGAWRGERGRIQMMAK